MVMNSLKNFQELLKAIIRFTDTVSVYIGNIFLF